MELTMNGVRMGRPRTAKDLPTSRSRLLGWELRRLREAARLTQGDVGRALGCGITKISRIESGHRAVSPDDLCQMLVTYGLTENGSRWERLLTLSYDADDAAWWDAYADVLPEDQEFSTYLGLEDSASELRSYQPLVVNGLLQTADYARVLIESNNVCDESETTDRLVEVRMSRQALLTRAERPVHLWTVLDEAALRRLVGGRKVMRAQLARLVEVARLSNVTIQVLPFTEGAYGGMVAPFMIIGFPEHADADVVLMENMSGNVFLECDVELCRYNTIFDRLRARAASPEASVEIIENIREEL
jgi:transcriptional regulator with XRE-family HTH domain